MTRPVRIPTTATISISDPAVQSTTTFGVGTTKIDAVMRRRTDRGRPWVKFTSGGRVISGSQPTETLGAWTFTITATQAGSLDLSVRCLNNAASDGDPLDTPEPTQTVTIPAGQTGPRK